MNVIIDYKVGNLLSVQRGFDRAGIPTIITNDQLIIEQATILILPGVGAFKDAMNDLIESGLVPLIKQHVQQGKLLFGVCLGMQLLFESSDEFEYTEGLNLISGKVQKLNVSLKVPHMGWNTLSINRDHPIVANIITGDFVYFIHSYYALMDPKYVIAYTDYEIKVPAIVQNNNVIGMQFHPEKSGTVGLRLLQALKEMIA